MSRSFSYGGDLKELRIVGTGVEIALLGGKQRAASVHLNAAALEGEIADGERRMAEGNPGRK